MKRFSLLLLLFLSLASFAVTKEEMEQARAITAKQYLRYANNGSDYLDKLEPKTLSELEGQLKAKEKENIVAFKKVSVPGDYASWDKDKLVEYWSATFFKDSNLSEKGKEARTSVKKKIGSMTVSAPAPEKPAENPSAVDENVPQIAPEDIQEVIPVEEELKAKEESLAAKMETAEAEELPERGDSATSIYIVILVLLIAVVITLVVYAAKVFRGSGQSEEYRRKEREREERDSMQREKEHRRALESMSDSLSERESEIKSLRIRCEKAEGNEARLRADLENALRDNDTLRSRIASLQTRLEAVTVPSSAPVSPVPEARRELSPAPRRKSDSRERIFLSHADARGVFVKATKDFRPGVTVFSLTTADGITGTFDIVDDGDVIEDVIAYPKRTIAYAVSAELPDNPDEVTGIQTESAGTAVYEDGSWRVVRKARLRFER